MFNYRIEVLKNVLGFQIQILTKISTTIMLNVSISHNMYNVQELHSGGGKTPRRFEMG